MDPDAVATFISRSSPQCRRLFFPAWCDALWQLGNWDQLQALWDVFLEQQEDVGLEEEEKEQGKARVEERRLWGLGVHTGPVTYSAQSDDTKCGSYGLADVDVVLRRASPGWSVEAKVDLLLAGLLLRVARCTRATPVVLGSRMDIMAAQDLWRYADRTLQDILALCSESLALTTVESLDRSFPALVNLQLACDLRRLIDAALLPDCTYVQDDLVEPERCRGEYSGPQRVVGTVAAAVDLSLTRTSLLPHEGGYQIRILRILKVLLELLGYTLEVVKVTLKLARRVASGRG